MSEGRLKPRKVPRQLRAEAMVSAVVEAAARILEHHGLKGYNTNAVARVAGVSIGSLYQYFPHKDAITRALIDREALSLIGQLEGIAGGRHGADTLKDVVAAAVSHLMRSPNLSKILDAQEQELALQEYVMESEHRVQRLIQICLADSQFLLLSDAPTIVADMIGIIRGMVDGAVANRECDTDYLIERVHRAIKGYIVLSLQNPKC